jgi:hypothetical protein
MWTDRVTWFSDEDGKKGRIQEGMLADLTVPDRDFFSCPEGEIADITSLLTVVGGKVVYGARDFASFDENGPPPAMPDWSPVRRYGGYGAWGEKEGRPMQATLRSTTCGCERACVVHGHRHAAAARTRVPASDLQSFWGALGCACWAV